MAFKFQLNPNIKFDYNQKFLAQADANEPTLIVHQQSVKRWYTLNTQKQLVPLPNKLIQLPLHRDDCRILDFGDHYVGHLALDLSAHGAHMDAPLTLKFQFAEVPAELALDSANYTGWLSRSWIAEEVFHIDSLPTSLRLPRRYSFRYVKITVIDTSPKWQVLLTNPIVTATSAVDEENLPRPTSKDPELREIERVSTKTLAECMQNVFEDGPKRDQRLWLGDLHLQALANYATFNHPDLVKRCLYLFAGMPTTRGLISANIFTHGRPAPDDTFLFDYSLFFISCLKDYVDQTHDRATGLTLYPIAQRQLDLALTYVDHNGKLQLPESWPAFIDWGDIYDKTTAAQGVLISVLRDFLVLTTSLKLPTSTIYQASLERTTRYAQTTLFDADQGLFTSGPKHEFNLYSQVWMALAKVLPSKQTTKLMQKAYRSYFPVTGIATPYMYHFIVTALLESGLRTEGRRLLKTYWGGMIAQHADTFWEAYKPEDSNYSPYGNPLINSYCHAWACTPAYLIKKYQL
ncbi:alpha-rhamnosidase [Lactobacillus sp. CBA3606]|uniref:alpha-L-rhamnosidase-related protein n=1 Tax=Lactobacillus sp. CBA3606 TaxID=2099789 RepID=UPI000CFB458A|nr:family 78 glycoside hydrolase catalytic domain [Lactobacillus sp. CBA3606]AVK64106.1 alpha-rhamnosidase [Lactobacillus sp. CBA3606]